MAKSLVFFAALSTLMFTSNTASAHPGTKILTTGSTQEQAAMTAGISFEEQGEVHIFRGQKKMADVGATNSETTSCATVVKIMLVKPAFRKLRTQGFYSGTGYKSRRFTKGFYSGH